MPRCHTHTHTLWGNNSSMLRHRLHCAGVTHRTRSHDMYWRHGVAALFRRTCAVRPCGSVSAVVHACRCAATATLSVAPSSPTASGTTPTLKPSPQQPPATPQSPRPPTPPPLSLLSWAVDGSGHTHHRCRRRLSMQERIPFICETIRATAPDVVALQDSTSELAEALTNGPDESILEKSWTPVLERRLRLYGAD
ncbi:hypothetical protein, conserved [Leishmania tarentolae]|uniref:Endonuclease/exonuclease/phosphatase domain-containing protein n=1 Tax=Leishmania tarentolae TaxID=5689 RepID=A0A640KE02_LEITA|nr:hypothetical protein, conserved [Leishmania tarentolae]